MWLPGFRSSSWAVLPLAYLNAFTLGLLELPVLYLFKSMRCEEISGGKHCASPVVQKAYTADMGRFLFIVTALSIAVSGPFGSISDKHGRKRVMAIAGSLNAFGDLWLVLCAGTRAFHNPYMILVAAACKGAGGGFTVLMTAHSTYIADTSSLEHRSFFLGLAVVMYWVASAIAPLLSGLLLAQGRYTTNFGVAFGSWIVYVLYLTFALVEKRTPTSERTTNSPTAHRSLLRTITEPLAFVFSDPTLRWLSIVTWATLFALGSYSVLVPYCDSLFGLNAKQAGVLASIIATSRAGSILLALPALVYVIRYFIVPKKAAMRQDPSEDSPLLPAKDVDTAHHTSRRTTAKQELIVSRICLVIDAVAMAVVPLARNAKGIAAVTTLGALGAGAGPSIQALVTLAAPNEQLGRVLAGYSIVESASFAMRGPILFAIYGSTIEKFPGAIWLFAGGLLLLAAGIMGCLKYERFVK